MTEANDPSLVLASASPRRESLLRQVGIAFRVVPATIDETLQSGESAQAFVERIAIEKARAVWAVSAGVPVLGADTVVVVDEVVYGKPRDREHGLAMLRSLSGRGHRVLSGVALFDGRIHYRLSESRVQFRVLSEREIEAYWASGEPLDKAGAYAIQGLGAVFIERLEGSYSGVMGLPLYETAELLKEINIPLIG